MSAERRINSLWSSTLSERAIEGLEREIPEVRRPGFKYDRLFIVWKHERMLLELLCQAVDVDGYEIFEHGERLIGIIYCLVDPQTAGID